MALATLEPGDRAHGFEASAIYLDAAGRPMGARFLHDSGFQLDLLQIDSVPQAFTWVKSFPISNRGESHVLEHMLNTRGTRGRTLLTMKPMLLVEGSVYTAQWRTHYHFSTCAGIDEFFAYYEELQRALLSPDFSDAEIPLEVWNFGVTEDGDGQLRLVEKGSVYNEMVSAMSTGFRQVHRARRHVLHGEDHPLGFVSGGEPAAIRTMTAEHVRAFHSANYHLGNMGAVAAFPRSATLGDVLGRFDRVLSDAAPGAARRPAATLDRFLRPAGDVKGAIRIYEYPHSNAEQPSPLMVVWPATRLDPFNELLAELFFHSFAGNPGTNLYELLVDSRTRQVESGASEAYAWVRENGVHAITIFIEGVRPAKMGNEDLRQLRDLVVDEIMRVAQFADGSTELKEFNDRVASQLVDRQRDMVKFPSTPPRFGARWGGAGANWLDFLNQLEGSSGPRKSLVMKTEFDQVRDLLRSERNAWPEALARWGVLDVDPYLVGARPSPARMESERSEREARLQAETKRLMEVYGTTNPQEALRRYAADSKRDRARIELATKVSPGRFVDDPPMTFDDEVQFDSIKLSAGIDLVASRFDSMTGAMIGLALRVDGVPAERLLYLSVMPDLLIDVGVIEDGKPLSVEEMNERMQHEVLAFEASFRGNRQTGRVELHLCGSGVGLKESGAALDWIGKVLHAPNWRPENLPRIRDVVDQQLAALRSKSQDREENWVRDPSDAWLMQHHPAWLASHSFLTRSYNTLRLRWQLMDPAAPDRNAVTSFLTRLADSGTTLDRPGLKALLKKEEGQCNAPGWSDLSADQKKLAAEALEDLDLSLDEIPDSSLGTDFRQLTLTLCDDLATPVNDVLERLDETRRRLGGARMFLASPQAMRSDLMPKIEAFAGTLDATPFESVSSRAEPLISARLRSRGVDAAPLHVGLRAPNMQGGVIMTAVPGAHFTDSNDKEKLLDYLAAAVYAGFGSHAAFSKTTGEGLAYTSKILFSESQAEMGYYAERTPDLPQTVRFLVDVIKNSQQDDALGEYAIAQAFEASRASPVHEERARSIAADLADNVTPQLVRNFRSALLKLRNEGLAAKLYERKDRVFARILPGYEANGRDPESRSFVIGPDKQLDAWEKYLPETDASGARFQRLYGRDFWMMGE